MRVLRKVRTVYVILGNASGNRGGRYRRKNGSRRYKGQLILSRRFKKQLTLQFTSGKGYPPDAHTLWPGWQFFW
jgi:hypothetical protein